jgi:hypothetical protein
VRLELGGISLPTYQELRRLKLGGELMPSEDDLSMLMRLLKAFAPSALSRLEGWKDGPV